MFEVEIKSLLGEKENVEALKEKMREFDPGMVLVASNKQRNHYFNLGNIEQLQKNVESLLSKDAQEKLGDIFDKGNDFSVRTRQKDNTVLLVIKASIDDTTSENGISRMEFEEPVNTTLEELDKLLLDAGFTYQAKWSREREEYTCKGTTVCLDKNAGYGYLAEFERMVEDEREVTKVRDELRVFMSELGAEELSQERLARMFDFYNKNWPEYYGTEKVFVIE